MWAVIRACSLPLGNLVLSADLIGKFHLDGRIHQLANLWFRIVGVGSEVVVRTQCRFELPLVTMLGRRRTPQCRRAIDMSIRTARRCMLFVLLEEKQMLPIGLLTWAKI